jgi:uncharacterized protein
MTLTDKINIDMKEALKAGEKVRLEVLRSIRAGILEFEKSGVGREMTSDDEIGVLNAAAKKRRDAIQMYSENDRPDAAAKEEAELAIIQEYLPAQLSAEELKGAVAEVIASVGASGPGDFGKVMGAAMKQLKGKADGNAIQAAVKEQLNG